MLLGVYDRRRVRQYVNWAGGRREKEMKLYEINEELHTEVTLDYLFRRY